MRIAERMLLNQTAGMSGQSDTALMDYANQLAFDLFGDQTEDDHVIAVYYALAALLDAGLPIDGIRYVH